MTSHRLERVQDLLLQEISRIIQHTFRAKNNAFITVTRVSVPPNLSTAKVFVIVYPLEQSSQTLDALKKYVPILQQALNKRLVMKHVPRVIFARDVEEEEAARMEETLQRLATNKNEREEK